MSAQPDFINASPTVYGFDFNALANTAAGSAVGVPDSHSAPVVRHGAPPRTGNDAVSSGMAGLHAGYGPREPPVGDRPPGYPWEGHGDTIPGYPWEGHPQIAYSQPFLGPEGTSPQTRSGPNVGAYASAPAAPLSYTGGPYPYAESGTYTPNPTPPSAGAYAGFDLGDKDARLDRRQKRSLARQANKTQIDVTDGPYVYRLYSGGAFAANKARQRQATLTALAQGITGVTAAVGGAGKRKKGKKGRKGKGQGGQGGQGGEIESPLPAWVVPVGIAVLVGGLLLVASKRGK